MKIRPSNAKYNYSEQNHATTTPLTTFKHTAVLNNENRCHITLLPNLKPVEKQKYGKIEKWQILNSVNKPRLAPHSNIAFTQTEGFQILCGHSVAIVSLQILLSLHKNTVL